MQWKFKSLNLDHSWAQLLIDMIIDQQHNLAEASLESLKATEMKFHLQRLLQPI